MIYIRDKTGRIHQGLNLYPFNSTHSLGGVLRLGSWQVRLRWSKNAHRFFGSITRVDLNKERKTYNEFFGVKE
jgi:hypothetical protein